MTIQAAYYTGHRTFTLEEKDDPAPGTGEVQIRVAYVGICGTDMHVYHGNMDARMGSHRVIGHEMSGTISAVGEGVEGVTVGDTLYYHITNLEQDWDVPHGFAMMGMENSELLIMPGQTRTLKTVATRVGVIPFYCTDFCSALHQEMQGYIRVSPKGEKVPLTWGTGKPEGEQTASK